MPGDDLKHRFPFRFVIPRFLAEPFLQLPPSMEEGREFVNVKNGKRYMQPLIVYEICSSLTYVGGGIDSRWTRVDDRHAIQLVPRLICGPPIEVEDFPGEFQTTSVRRLRQGLLRSHYGQMTMSADEPGPLCLDAAAFPMPTTVCLIQVEYTPARGLARSNVHLKPWLCNVRPQLHVKTYYSTCKLWEMPRKPRRSTSSDIRLRSEVIELGSRELRLGSWQAADWTASSWTTTVSLPVSAPSQLLPAFVTGLAARSYALKLTVRLPGVAHKPFELEVPLQVAYETPAS